MRIIASDLISYYRPSECELRLYLRQRGEKEEPRSEFEQLLAVLGRRHEANHLSTLGAYADITSFPEDERAARTKEAISSKTPVVYQGKLTAKLTIAGESVEVTGQPDFLLAQQSGYVIRDSKISLRITEKDHPEILLQLQLYGWLFEQTFGAPPAALEVHSGRGTIVPVPYDKGAAVLQVLEQIVKLNNAKSEPYSPVGWTKCGSCGFNSRCWEKAVAEKDVALVMGVDQGLAFALHDLGVSTRSDLLSRYDAQTLGDLKRPYGKSLRKVGAAAPNILRMADVMERNCEVILMKPLVPDHANYCMFDLEGMPPHLDELEKIYLWGLQVFGQNGGDYLPATAGFGVDGEREGWEQFLRNAEAVLTAYGDIPMVHWSHYERTKLDMYVDKFGDRDNLAQRVRANLLDLHPIATMSIALPVSSYGLKVIEQYVGFKRKMNEYGGDWAMAKYIEATETEDEKLRASVMEKILAYNREDLEATWAVLQWLKSKSS
jgi:predicted RecB family nuclease